jgi:hypothetical protein
MEVGQGPNWGCVAKERKNLKLGHDCLLIPFRFIIHRASVSHPLTQMSTMNLPGG